MPPVTVNRAALEPVRADVKRWLRCERILALLLLALAAAAWILGQYATQHLHAHPKVGGAIFSPWILLLPAGVTTFFTSWAHAFLPKWACLACHVIALLFAGTTLVVTATVWWLTFSFGLTWTP